MGYTEHRCQCCGEIAEQIFCEDCRETDAGDTACAAIRGRQAA